MPLLHHPLPPVAVVPAPPRIDIPPRSSQKIPQWRRNAGPTWDGNEHLNVLLNHIRTAYPYWNRTQGRDHFFVSGVTWLRSPSLWEGCGWHCAHRSGPQPEGSSSSRLCSRANRWGSALVPALAQPKFALPMKQVLAGWTSCCCSFHRRRMQHRCCSAGLCCCYCQHNCGQFGWLRPSPHLTPISPHLPPSVCPAQHTLPRLTAPLHLKNLPPAPIPIPTPSAVHHC